MALKSIGATQSRRCDLCAVKFEQRLATLTVDRGLSSCLSRMSSKRSAATKKATAAAKKAADKATADEAASNKRQRESDDPPPQVEQLSDIAPFLLFPLQRCRGCESERGCE